MFERIPPSKRFVGYIFLFVIVVLSIFVTLSSGFSAFQNKKYVIYFNRSISGLRSGSLVYYKGVPVGSARLITIDLPMTNRVKVVIRVKRDVPLYEGCVAKISAQGLISGNYCLDLCNPDNCNKLLDGIMPEIKSSFSDFEKAVEEIPKVFVKITRLVDALDSVISTNKVKVGSSITKFCKLIDNVDKLIELNKINLTNIVTKMVELTDNISISAKNFNNFLPIAGESIKELNNVLALIKKEVQIFTDADTMFVVLDCINNLNIFSTALKNATTNSNSKLRYLLAG